MLVRTLSVAVVCLSIPLWADPLMVVSKVNAGATLTPSKSLNFNSTEVRGYSDNPETLVLFGNPDKDDSAIQLNRSFGSEIRQNVDKETLERIVE